MDKLISVFVGDRACDAGLAYLYLESQQIFQECDPINHEVVFEDISDEIRPRSLFFGNNQEIQTAMNQVKVQKIKQQEIQLDHSSPYQKVVDGYLDNVKLRDENFYKIVQSGIQIRESELEGISDTISRQLERLNHCDGFQVIVDTLEAQKLGMSIIEQLKDQSPKSPMICCPYHETNSNTSTQALKDLNFFNRALGLINLSEVADVVCPISFPISQFDFYQQRMNHLSHSQFGILFSSITLPYRVQEDQLGFSSFIQRMTPYKSCNIFNLVARVPSLQDQENDHILNHKKKLVHNAILQNNYIERVVYYEQQYQSFAESYSLRGETPIPEDRELNSIGIDIRLLNDILNVPHLVDQGIFSQNVTDQYSFSASSEEPPRISQLPLHTCMFSNECYKFTLKNQLNRIEQVKQKMFMYLEKEEFTYDDYHEFIQKVECKIDSYGGLYDDDEEENVGSHNDF